MCDPVSIGLTVAGAAVSAKQSHDQRKLAREQARDAQIAQNKQEEILRRKGPEAIRDETQDTRKQTRLRDLRAGLQSVVKTSALGLSGQANTSAPAAGGWKKKLGE